MYKVTFLRSGKYPRFNLKGRGEFTKEFQSIDEIAKFLADNRLSICMKENNLSRSESYVLFRKFRALDRRRYLRERKSVV